jgi:hypothetical protein
MIDNMASSMAWDFINPHVDIAKHDVIVPFNLLGDCFDLVCIFGARNYLELLIFG